ncbi:zinc finger protein 84 [Trichonephila inaurata madagascariensis]|uniref:Zinc finger protein 84 n=1 Tax=Trichonephila inaurata madagascariensis TaxID=2747483 RepID=A0A8X6YFX1_9ARAC|nr:zinc finger protein 84 [Trichonephila inaurata madagascariensis]
MSVVNDLKSVACNLCNSTFSHISDYNLHHCMLDDPLSDETSPENCASEKENFYVCQFVYDMVDEKPSKKGSLNLHDSTQVQQISYHHNLPSETFSEESNSTSLNMYSNKNPYEIDAEEFSTCVIGRFDFQKDNAAMELILIDFQNDLLVKSLSSSSEKL